MKFFLSVLALFAALLAAWAVADGKRSDINQKLHKYVPLSRNKQE